MKAAQSTPRKDLARVDKKRKRSAVKPVASKSYSTTASAVSSILPSSHASMDLEAILATLTDDAVSEAPQFPATTTDAITSATPQVNYYTYANPQQPQQPPPLPPPPPPPPPPAQTCNPSSTARKWKPCLLLRQSYNVGKQADVVIGLESTGDYKPSVYLVNSKTSVSLSIEDVLGLRGVAAAHTVDTCFYGNPLSPIYLDTILLESNGNGSLVITNYHVKSSNKYRASSEANSQSHEVQHETDIVRHGQPLLLLSTGWNSLKKLFDCIESYYFVCAECTSAILYLMHRYVRYFTKAYRTKALMARNCSEPGVPSTLSHELLQDISANLPIVLQELDEKRVPTDASLDGWYDSSGLRPFMISWIDSEVRRYCVPNILDLVLDNLTFVM